MPSASAPPKVAALRQVVQMKKLLIAILLPVFLAGCLFAVSGASISGASQTRWSGVTTASSLTTQGGNISVLNINTTQLTYKWTSFSGNISGTIVLGNNTASVYSWTYSAAQGGRVCVSTSNAQTFVSLTNATFANIDSGFNTSGAPDNSAGTFNTTCPTLVIATGAMTGFIAARTQSNSTFTTCAATTAGGVAIGNHIFCTNVNSSGRNYANVPANFEMIAPAGSSGGVSYFFYAELL